MPDDPRLGIPDGERPGGDRPADDGWPGAPDAWEVADRAYRAKWSGRAPADEPDAGPGPPPPSYTPTRATPRVVTDSYRDGMQAAGPYIGLGVQIAASMAVFAGGGYALDRWLGTSPWGILVGATLGMVGIVFLIVRVAREADAESKRKRGGQAG